MGLDVSFYLMNADGSYRCALPEPATWALSPIANDAGAVKLDYPTVGRNFEQLREHCLDGTDAEIAVWTNGRDEGLRAWLNADDSDDVADDAVWTFTGNFGEVRLEDAVIADRTEVVTPPTGEAPTEDVAAFRVYSATAGTILRTLLQEANDRGTLVDIDWSTFTNTTDSNGVAWSKVITLKIAPGTNYLDVAKSLVSYQLCEFRMVGRSLRLYEYGTMGRDLTTGTIAEQVTIRKGRDITDSPRKRSIRKAATDILLAGAEGLYRTVSDATARARRGRQVEQYRSQGSIADEGTLLAYGAVELERAKNGTTSITHGLTFEDPASPVPLRDFREGDWVWSDTGQPGGPERLQVAQVTIEGDSDGIRKGSATLNDLIASREAQLAQRVKGIEGGSTLTGTSQARPVDEGPDTTVPAAPQGLVLSSSAYPAGAGKTEAQISAAWADVTTNDDATAIDDLDHYAVRFRYASDQGLPTEWQPAVDTLDTTPALSFSPFVPGADVEAQVQAIDRSGNASVWSSSAFVTTAVDDQPPPVPSTPEAGSIAGVYTLAWDGRGSLGEAMGDDFRAAEWHASTTTGFTADRPIGADGKVDLSASTTYRGEFRAGNVLALRTGEPGIVEGAELFSCLVAVDTAGNASAQSAETSAIPGLIEEGDIASVNIGVLTSGIMNAVLTIANTIQTASDGSRVVLDTAGFRCVNDAGDEVLNYSIAQELLTMVGKFLTSTTANARIEIDPVGPDGNPTASFFSGNGSIYGPARLNAFDRDGGRTGLGINSGLWSNATDAMYSRVFLAPDGSALEVVRNGDQITIGGKVFANDVNAGMQLFDSDGDVRSWVELVPSGNVELNTLGNINLFADGDIWLGADGEVNAPVPFGSPTNGFSFWPQAGDTPTQEGIRLWATGGTIYFIDNALNQTISDGAGGTKTFVIDHPVDTDRLLVHATTESPHNGVEYWGEVEVVDGHAEVELPAYFEALTRPDGRQVQVSVVLPDEPLRRVVEPPPPVPRAQLRRRRVEGPPPAAESRATRPARETPAQPAVEMSATAEPPKGKPVVIPERALLPRAAASSPRDGRFRITCDGPDGTRVAWLVKAIRADVEPLVDEPRRADVDVRGDGPYRYIVRRPAGGKAGQ